ncbi:MAG: hypothetical protein IT374_05295 [Polyangiaceae bacterium]|nr:hypothetical protein [Polyangiaceae bacterium]
MRRTLSPCLLTGLLLALSSPALAATYQVGPSRAHKTLQAVASLLSPGDVVELDGDATYAGGVVFDVPGAAAAKITIRGVRVNGKRPVISGATNTVEAQGDHYVFEGLELTGGSFRCFYHHADDITLQDSVIHDCPKHGLLGADEDSGSLLLQYVEVYGCGSGTQNHQIYMATDETAHPGSVFRMQSCYVHDATGGNNVKSRAERNEIYGNWIEGALYHELELIGPDGQDPSLAREDSDVVGNVLVKTNDFAVVRFGGDGTGETGGRYRFAYNTVVAGQAAVFRLFDSIESLEVHNSVFLRPGGAVNLVREVEAAWVTGSSLIAGSNNWVQTGAANQPPAWVGTLTGADPGLSIDRRPQAGSALLDAASAAPAGVPGHAFPNPLAKNPAHPPLHTLEALGGATPRPTSGAPDIGAFELDTGAGGSGGAGGSNSAGSAGANSAGSAGANSAGSAGANSAGSAGANSAGAGGSSSAGSSGATSAGSGGASSAGAGGSSSAGSSGATSAGSGGASGAGAGGSSSAGKGGSSSAGSGGASSGGSSGATSAGSGGASGAGKGGSSAGGASGSLGVSGSAGKAGSAGQAPAAAPVDSGDDGGCGCAVPRAGGHAGLLALGALAAAVTRRRARRSTR